MSQFLKSTLRSMNYRLKGGRVKMIKVMALDRTLGISFSHPYMTVKVKDLLGKRGKNLEYVRKVAELAGLGKLAGMRDEIVIRTTLCQLFELGADKKDLKLLADGLSVCSILDNFDKRIGRNLALEDALNPKKFDRATRAVIWDAYLNRDVDDVVVQIETGKRAEFEKSVH